MYIKNILPHQASIPSDFHYISGIMTDEHEHDGPMSEIRKVAYAMTAAKVSGNTEEFSRLCEEYRQLLVKYPDTASVSECSCGCLENDNIYKMLGEIGRFSPECYAIAFDTGHLSKTIEYGSNKKKVRKTTDMVNSGFYFMTDRYEEFYTGTLYIPVEEARKNIMETIDVFHANFEKGDGLAQLAWISRKRTDDNSNFGKFEREYPVDLPTSFICCTLMNYVINPTRLNITETFVWDLLLKFYDCGVPFPDVISEWVDDKTRPIAKSAEDNDGKIDYVKVLRVMSPIQAIVNNGGLHALKGLYERNPEMVRKGLIGVDFGEYRSKIDYWKKTSSSYEKYHANAEDILAEMESFVASIV